MDFRRNFALPVPVICLGGLGALEAGGALKVEVGTTVLIVQTIDLPSLDRSQVTLTSSVSPFLAPWGLAGRWGRAGRSGLWRRPGRGRCRCRTGRRGRPALRALDRLARRASAVALGGAEGGRVLGQALRGGLAQLDSWVRTVSRRRFQECERAISSMSTAGRSGCRAWWRRGRRRRSPTGRPSSARSRSPSRRPERWPEDGTEVLAEGEVVGADGRALRSRACRRGSRRRRSRRRTRA